MNKNVKENSNLELGKAESSNSLKHELAELFSHVCIEYGNVVCDNNITFTIKEWKIRNVEDKKSGTVYSIGYTADNTVLVFYEKCDEKGLRVFCGMTIFDSDQELIKSGLIPREITSLARISDYSWLR